MRATTALLDHDKIVIALEEIGAIVGKALQRDIAIRIYGGAALIHASNFRATTRDIDYVANKIRPLPSFLRETRRDDPENEFLFAASEVVGKKHGYKSGWFNYQVLKTISGTFDHHELSHHEHTDTFPANEHTLSVYVPSLDYILAMKLQALRINKDDNYKDLSDLLCLMRIKGNEIKNPDDLVKIHARFYSSRQRRLDFEARIEQLWYYHTAGKIPAAIRGWASTPSPRYLGCGCGSA
jgi:hypothetical protein